MKAKEVRNMAREEIENKIISLKETLFKIRASKVGEQVDRPARFKLLRRDIARCYTILRELENERPKTKN